MSQKPLSPCEYCHGGYCELLDRDVTFWDCVDCNMKGGRARNE